MSAGDGGRAPPSGGGPGGLAGRLLRETGEAHVLGLARLCFGMLLASLSMTLYREARHEFFLDAFYISFLPDALLPSEPVFRALLAAHALLAAWVIVGWRSRPALGMASLVGLYLLLANRLEFHNNRYALYCYAFLLSFSPCDRAFALFAPAAPSAYRGPLWAARLVQAQASLVYLASGLSKLADPDWRGGVVLGDRALRFLERRRLGWPVDPFLAWFSNPHVSSPFSKVVIATELFLALGLWAKRARAAALWVGFYFHLTIEITQQVQLFSYTTLTVYLLFVTPATRERALEVPPARAALGWVLRRLDWLARFDVRAADEGAPFAAVDRDGRRATGFSALVLLCRALPLLFPLWLPLAALERALDALRARRAGPARALPATMPDRKAAPAPDAEAARRHLAASDRRLAALVERVGPFSFEPRPAHSTFRALAEAVVHQQLTVGAASTIVGRLRALYPGKAFPAPSDLLSTDEAALRSVGLSGAKTAALYDLAQKSIEGVVPPARELDALSDDEIVARLTAVRGVGRWTVEMLLIFRLGRPDVWPVDDYGVRKGFALTFGWASPPAPRELLPFGERLRPYRTAAAWYLWRAVDLDKNAMKQSAPKPSTPGEKQVRKASKLLYKNIRQPEPLLTPVQQAARPVAPFSPSSAPPRRDPSRASARRETLVRALLRWPSAARGTPTRLPTPASTAAQ